MQTQYFKLCPRCRQALPPEVSFCRRCGHGFARKARPRAWLLALFPLAVALPLVMTNPSQQDFQQWMMAKARASDDPNADPMIGALSKAFAGAIVSANTRRWNYGVCSVYEMGFDGMVPWRVVGIAQTFVPLQEGRPKDATPAPVALPPPPFPDPSPSPAPPDPYLVPRDPTPPDRYMVQ